MANDSDRLTAGIACKRSENYTMKWRTEKVNLEVGVLKRREIIVSQEKNSKNSYDFFCSRSNEVSPRIAIALNVVD